MEFCKYFTLLFCLFFYQKIRKVPIKWHETQQKINVLTKKIAKKKIIQQKMFFVVGIFCFVYLFCLFNSRVDWIDRKLLNVHDHSWMYINMYLFSVLHKNSCLALYCIDWVKSTKVIHMQIQLWWKTYVSCLDILTKISKSFFKFFFLRISTYFI